MPKPAIFLDRDGVVVESRRAPGEPAPPASVDDIAIIDGVAAALDAFRAAGYALVIVTNQPDVARGMTARAAVDAINERIASELPIDAIYVCFHDGSECECRKPRPGMLLDAARDLDLDLEQSWMIGDRWVDIAAGVAAGVRTILIEHSYSWDATSSGPPPANLAAGHVVLRVADTTKIILAV